MHIAVCIKQILDPEVPPRAFKIDQARKDAVKDNASLVIGPFDLNALEVALQAKDKWNAKVTALTVGDAGAQEALRRALAMGADEAVLLSDPLLEQADPYVIARVLAAAIKRLGDVEVVLCGRQDGDWDFGQVGALLAEALGLPFVPFVARLEAAGDGWRLERETDKGQVAVSAPRAMVATITNAPDNQPRLPKVRDIMMAKRKPLSTWSVADVGLSPSDVGAGARRLEVVDLFIPQVESRCEFIEGDDGAARGAALARRLVELGLFA